jgi:hypothetical protein
VEETQNHNMTKGIEITVVKRKVGRLQFSLRFFLLSCSKLFLRQAYA